MQFSMIVSVLRGMLGETSGGVERLELDLGCPWVDVYEVLKGVRKVRVLRVVDEQDEQMVRKVVEALVVSPMTSSSLSDGRECFLPRLRVLEWRGHCWVDLAMVKWLVEKLKMRWEMDSQCLSSSSSVERVGLEKVTLDLTCGGHLLGLMDGERLVSDEVRGWGWSWLLCIDGIVRVRRKVSVVSVRVRFRSVRVRVRVKVRPEEFFCLFELS